MSDFMRPEWFIGVVELVEPAGNGRLKVRCFGYHPDAKSNEVATNDLPWAWIINGNFNKMFNWPEVGTVVFGFFMDGRDAQRPMVIGSVSGGIYTSLPHDVLGIAETTGDATPISGGCPAGTPFSAADENALWEKLETQEAARRAAAGLPRQFSAAERGAIKGILASEGGSSPGNLAVMLNRSYSSKAPIEEIVFATKQFTPASTAAGINFTDMGATSSAQQAGAERFTGGYTCPAIGTLSDAISRYSSLTNYQDLYYFNAASLGVVNGSYAFTEGGQNYMTGRGGAFASGGRTNYNAFINRLNASNVKSGPQ